MRRPRDLQIFWVVLIAGGFWAAIWQHDEVAKLWKTVSEAAIVMTSSIRGVAPPPANPPEAPSGRAQRSPSQAAPKGGGTEPPDRAR